LEPTHLRARRAHHTLPAFSDATHRGVVESPPAGRDPATDGITGGPEDRSASSPQVIPTEVSLNETSVGITFA